MVMKPEPWAEALDARRRDGARGRGRVPHLVVPGPGGVPFTQALARDARRTSRGWPSPAGATRASTSASTSTPRDPDAGVGRLARRLRPQRRRGRRAGDGRGGRPAAARRHRQRRVARRGVARGRPARVPRLHQPASWDDAGTAREVPPVLLSGDHGAIAAWRHAAAARAHRRPPPRPAAGRRPRSEALADLDVRVATPARCRRAARAAAGLLGARGLAAHGRWVVPPLVEELADVVAGLGEWTTYAVRVRSADGSPGRLVGSVRGRVPPGRRRRAGRWAA